MSCIGILIGFYGFLFPGNINLMVVYLFESRQYKLLSFILILILTFEFIYSSITLLFLQYILHNHLLYHGIEIFSFILLAALGISMVVDGKNDVKTVQDNTTKRGIFAIIIHPQQIPFWMALSSLFNSIIYKNMYLFITYNAIGVLLIMLAYMVIGKWLLSYFKLKLSIINRAIG